MAAMSHMPNIADLPVSIHKITNGINILTNPVLAGDMIPDSFHCYTEWHLRTKTVSGQMHILIQGYEITYETHQSV